MIKHLIFALFISLVAILSAQPETLLREGNELYKAEDYSGALNKYSAVLNEGFESPVLYFNLGNAHFRSGNLGEAILFYEKGLKLSPGDEDIEYNLAIAKARTVDKIEEIPQIFLVEWWDTLLASFSVSTWGIFLLLWFVLFTIAVAIFITAKSGVLQRIGFWSGAVFLSFTIIVGLFLFADYTRETSRIEGVLLSEVVSVKVSPDKNSNDAFILHEGVKFRIEDNVGDWSRIKLSDGKVGWVNKTTYEII
ncbi:MAG: hypothetical protein SCALA702_09910 [Melioribacteraceae bacterium]|nr:MAG: hypothetical protein SCALA702_09910 [Melioribacteraceae bacterium]